MKYKYKKIKLSDGTTKDEHSIIMEKFLGRIIKTNEVVHHKNGNTLDNRMENLELTTRSAHTKITTNLMTYIILVSGLRKI